MRNLELAAPEPKTLSVSSNGDRNRGGEKILLLE
jgi:hypothetical protein